MKYLFNLTTSPDDMDRFSCRGDLLDLLTDFDGVELMYFGEDEKHILANDDVVGFHMGYFPYWVDFWNGKEEELVREFGSRQVWERVYGGKDRNAIVNYYKREMDHAHRFGAKYVVYHVSNATIAETFTMSYHLSDEEVIDATIELLNEILKDEDGTLTFLVENLWQPGLTFTRPEMTRRLLEGVAYANKGIMLDTGHLLHTDTSVRTQEEGIRYIHGLLDAHGDLCSYIRGVHLNQSLTGEYCEQVKSNPPNLDVSYQERQGLMFMHAFAVDKHQPFTCEGVDALLARIAPEYVTFEFITADSVQHRAYLNAQLEALKLK